MGTNFYMQRNFKQLIHIAVNRGQYKKAKKLMDEEYLHIAKTSAGWLPLFQAYDDIHSIQDYKNIYDKEHCKIYDEYGNEYDWGQFTERVLKHEGGICGAVPLEPYDQSGIDPDFRDYDMPDHAPVSHFEYGGGKYAYQYFKDEQGYEFTYGDFS